MQDTQPLPLAEGEDPSLLVAASGQSDDGENTTIDADYRRRLEKSQDDDALDFMQRMKGQLGLVPQPSEGQEQKPGAPVPSGQPGAPAPEQSPAANMGDPWSAERAQYMLGMGGSVAGDIASGVAKAPRAIYSGGIKAWDALAGLGNELIPMGTLQITDPKTGALSPGLVDTKEFEAAGGSDVLRGSLPDPVKPETVTEGLIGGMSQFLAGFGLAGKAFTAAGYGVQGGNVAQLARSVLQGGASSFAVFDGQEERLSNLIQQYPDLANPLTEFLAADEEDPEVVGRLKNVVENAIPDVGFAGILQGLRVMKAARRVKELTGAPTYQEAAEKLAANIEAGEVRPEPQPQQGVFDDLLGPEQGNVVERPAPAANPMFKEQEFGVPDDVVARGVVGAAEDGMAPAAQAAPAPQAEGALPEGVDLSQSKIVDDTGAPMKLYHGTGSEFEAFDPTKSLEGGVFFASDRSIAADYEYKGKTPRVIEAYADIRNPKIIDAGGEDFSNATLGKPREGEENKFGISSPKPSDEIKALGDYQSGFEAEVSTPLGRKMKVLIGVKTDQEVAFRNARSRDMTYDVMLPDGKVLKQDVFSTIYPGDDFDAVLKAGIRTAVDNPFSDVPVPRLFLKQIVDEAKAEGYDGLWLRNGSDFGREPHDQIVAFNADQIKQVSGGDGPAAVRRDGPGAIDASPGSPLPPGEGAGVGVEAPAVGGASKIDSPSGELYINWSRIDTSDGVKAVIRDMAEAFRPDIEQSTRGVRSNATTRGAAGNIDAFKTLMGERKIPLPSAEEQLALRQMWSAAGTKTLEIARLANENPSPENLFALRKMLSIHAAVQREVIGIRTETARALQQWSIPADAGEMRLRSLQQMLDANGGLDVNADLAAKIASLQGKEGAEGALNLMARKSASLTTFDAVREYWVNALLSGPKTHVVNMISNSGVIFHSMAERAISARIADWNGSVDGVRIGEASAMWYGAKQALPDAWRLFKDSLRTGETGGALGKTELPRVRAISREALGATTNETFNAAMNRPMMGAAIDAIGGLVNIPGRALGAADEFFKAINYRAELWAVAFRQASSDAERGIIKPDQIKSRMAEIILNPSDDIKIKSQDFAEYNTFTNDPGPTVKAVMRLRESYPAIHFILPFVQTPANILRYTLERTPLAPITQKFRTDFAAGGVRRQMALAQLGLGSAVMLTAYDIALNGQITGGGPKDGREKATLLRSGWQPYSVKVGKRYFAYNRFDPIGFYVGMAADMAEYATNTDTRVDADFEEVFSTALFSAANNFMDKSYLRGFATFIEAVQNSSGTGTVPERYMTGLATSFIPTGVAEVARQMTPERKYTHDLVSSAKARLPGYSKDLPPRRDFWGRPISYQSGLGKLYDATSPIYSREEKPEPIDKELVKLGYHPDAHDLYVRVSGQNVSIRNRPEIVDSYHRWIAATPASELPRDLANRKAGTEGLTRTVIKRLNSYGSDTMLETMNKLIEQPTYLDADDQEKESQIKEVISAYRAGARLKVVQDYPVLQELRSKMDD